VQAVPSAAVEGRRIAFGAFSFDRVSRILRQDDRELPLPPRVIGVLELLLDRPGEVVTKQALITAVWRDAFVTETSIAEAISVLRQTLGDDPQRPTYVQTLHRRGYRFIADVSGLPAAPGLPARPGPEDAAPVPSLAATAELPEREPALSALVPWLIALFAVLTAAIAIWRYVDTAPAPAPPPVRFSLALPAGLTLAAGAPLAVSADGTTIAFAACDGSRCAIYLRPLSQPEATPLAATAGGASPFFAPDGSALGFFADGRLQTLTLGGGSPATIATAAEPLGAAWLPDGQIVFARSRAEGLFVVAGGGHGVRPLTRPALGEDGHRWPAALPDGSGVVFTVGADPARPDAAYGAVVTLRTGSWARVLDGVGAVRVPAPGYLVAQRGDGLVASGFDARTRTAIGLPVPVTLARPIASSAPFAASAAGTVVSASAAGDAIDVVLHWTGELRRLVPPPEPKLPR
jgi:DNA-binding winged helix-turn-helix (wHTH) protein